MNPAPHTNPSTGAARLRRASATLALVGLLALGAAMFVPPLFGFERYVIVGSSMTGTIDRGSIVYDRIVPTASLRRGDIITYTPPPGADVHGLVTHRVVWIGRDRRDLYAFRTKGDANQSADPWRFTLRRKTQARVAFAIPYVGYALAALSIRGVRMLVIGAPALLVAFASLAGLWRDARAEARPPIRQAAADR